MPEVSIVINCFNEAAYIAETLDSVFAQTFDDWEVIFFDNASTDGSGDIAKSYGEKVRYFRSNDNLPLGKARNTAYKHATGRYVALLDADDIWHPEKLEKQLVLFRADPDLGLAFCDSMFFDQDGDRYPLFKHTPPKRGDIFGNLLVSNFIFSSAMMFRRDAVDQLGYAFDERYTRVSDYDLTLRMSYSYRADFVDEALCKWRINDWGDKAWKKDLVSRVYELKQAMSNLIDSRPDIQDKYTNELNAFFKMLDYQSGIEAWHDGDHSEARSHFSRHRRTKKFAFAYLCTFLLSHGVYDRARKFYRFNLSL